MIPAAKLERLLDRFSAIESEMASGASGAAFVKLSREHAELGPVIETAREYRSVQMQLEETEALIADPATDPDVLTINTDEVAKLNEALNRITQDEIAILPDGDGGAQDLGPAGTGDLFNRMDTALNSIAEYRATLGSVQSRLNSTITNIEISNENLSAAMSRIRDVDYASETAKFATSKILMQAGVSVLSQANTSSELALQLLR